MKFFRDCFKTPDDLSLNDAIDAQTESIHKLDQVKMVKLFQLILENSQALKLSNYNKVFRICQINNSVCDYSARIAQQKQNSLSASTPATKTEDTTTQFQFLLGSMKTPKPANPSQRSVSIISSCMGHKSKRKSSKKAQLNKSKLASGDPVFNHPGEFSQKSKQSFEKVYSKKEIDFLKVFEQNISLKMGIIDFCSKKLSLEKEKERVIEEGMIFDYQKGLLSQLKCMIMFRQKNVLAPSLFRMKRVIPSFKGLCSLHSDRYTRI